MKPPLRIILAGNPNVGKTTLFNALTGSRAKVSNYPGVTVDQHIGELQLPTGAAVLVDVPGTYSLVARSPEEFIALRAIAGLDDMPVPDAVVVCLDANQLARSAYLLLQCQELGARCAVALTMVDEQATPPDAAALSARLGCPVVPVVAATGRGLADLRMALATIIESPRQARHRWPPSAALAAALREVGQALPTAWRPYPEAETALALWALQSLDDDDELRDVPGELRRVVRQHQGPTANPALDDEPVLARWAWLDRELPSATQRPITRAASRTERLDQVLLHRVGGFALFMAIMTVMFLALFTWSAPFTDGLEALLGQVGTAARATLRPGLFADFVIDGVLGGVGAVLMFLPQILILFFLLGLLEDVGYLARVAYLMDRIMRAMNLHGRAFVPMLSGFACAVPAILATRTLERRRDRLLTMLVIPLMTCSARLPVYTLVITALLPGSALTQGLIMVGLYAFSVVAALLASLIMGRTMKPLKAKRLPFFVELPPYRWPRWRDIVRAMWQRSAMFLREAGTTIFVASVVLWALLAFPRQPLAPDASAEAVAEARATQLQHSYGGQLGHAMEPALAPLGFDWRIGIGLIGSFAAREVFVATLGVAVGSSPEGDDTKALVDTLRDQRTPSGARAYTPLVAISLLVFFALACQCMSTLAVIKRETQSWRWPLFVFSYMTVLAYLASLAVYQGGRLLGWQ